MARTRKGTQITGQSGMWYIKEGKCAVPLLEVPSSAPVPPLSLVLLPSSSSDLERVAGMRLRRGCSCTEAVLFALEGVGLGIWIDCEMVVAAVVCWGSESLVGCERVDESMVATMVIAQGQL